MTPAEEIIVAKAKLEAAMHSLILEFTEHTGCFVLRINAHPIDTTAYASGSTNPMDRRAYGSTQVELVGPS